MGAVKIGQFKWKSDQSRPKIPEKFECLSDDFFSLGQDVDYYKAMMEIAEDERNIIFIALQDVAKNNELYVQALKEEVMTRSLMRSTGPRKVEIQFRAVLNGGAELTPYKFTYRAANTQGSCSDPIQLDFEVMPGAAPPTNIHVLTGRNGVGKTHLLNGMTRALVSSGTSIEKDGAFWFKASDFDFLSEAKETFANLVSVTFSAFDDFLSIYEAPNAQQAIIGYTNVGLRKQVSHDEEQLVITQDIESLSSDFAESARICSRGVRRNRWNRALKTLETDSLFREIEIANFAEIVGEETFIEEMKKIYKRLSSGHKIVLLSITKLVELVEERSLVLMDEPEAHLHPPLLSAFVRALSDLLTDRNGVAIIATHSPVVIQEVPASCVWKITRHGRSSTAEKPDIETFAETVSVLTREIFGLEVDRSGFHKMILEFVKEEKTFKSVMNRFDGEIGAHGQALIRAMLVQEWDQGDD